MYLSSVFGKDNSLNKFFHVTIGNSKNTYMHNFYPHAQEIKYVQDDNNTFVLSWMNSTLFAANEHIAEHAFLSQISLSIKYNTVSFMNRINFSSTIITDHVWNQWEKWWRYKLFQWNNKG